MVRLLDQVQRLLSKIDPLGRSEEEVGAQKEMFSVDNGACEDVVVPRLDTKVEKLVSRSVHDLGRGWCRSIHNA